jgi:hypothetical protein
MENASRTVLFPAEALVYEHPDRGSRRSTVQWMTCSIRRSSLFIALVALRPNISINSTSPSKGDEFVTELILVKADSSTYSDSA